MHVNRQKLPSKKDSFKSYEKMGYFMIFVQLMCLLMQNTVSQKLLNTDDCREDIMERFFFRNMLQDISASMNKIIKVLDKRLNALESRVCDPDWTYFRQSCYIFSLDTATWVNAQQKCSQYGSSLVEIEGEEENNFIVSILGLHQGEDTYPWIGASDMVTEGKFVWNSTGLPLQFSFWAGNEPNDIDSSENCVHAYTRKDIIGRWNDRNCFMTSSYICEMKIM
ncbi:C-type lectin domain family 4 member E-like [Saccostrea cucullata]|uniref:C-type lectin domain family 4 member E-like n=1 Tax=Saccostrea cuccullata TaxID=36930 RepID=UPI002ED121AA